MMCVHSSPSTRHGSRRWVSTTVISVTAPAPVSLQCPHGLRSPLSCSTCDQQAGPSLSASTVLSAVSASFKLSITTILRGEHCGSRQWACKETEAWSNYRATQGHIITYVKVEELGVLPVESELVTPCWRGWRMSVHLKDIRTGPTNNKNRLFFKKGDSFHFFIMFL